MKTILIGLCEKTGLGEETGPSQSLNFCGSTSFHLEKLRAKFHEKISKTIISSILLCIMVSFTCGAEPILPEGTAPVPESIPHFPDRLHTFVFRNWNLVETECLAEVLGTTTENVSEIADSLGLPEYRKPGWSTEQIYITIIRRNWHLLPYEQILQLVRMTPQRLMFALQEDDFLFIKLGLLKPKCEPLHYSPPTDETKKRCAEIRAFLRSELGDRIDTQTEQPRFAFIDQLKNTDSDTPEKNQTNGNLKEKSNKNDDAGKDSLRFVYSYFALYGDPLLGDESAIFPDGLLQKLSRYDVNGVWLHVVLRDLAPGGPDFPEFGKDCEKRLESLRKLVARADRFGVKIYLYMNEPRSMPNAFFQNSAVPEREKMAGVAIGNDYHSLCISRPEVQNWIKDSLSHLFREVPGLGGVFTISGSENYTHCNSHGAWKSCPNCKEKSGAEITALSNALIEEGVHRSSPDAKVIVWDWGWNGHGISTDIIDLLPKNIWLMSVSEWALPITRIGVSSTVGEYSLSSVGPGPKARTHWEAAKKRGMKTAAKVQLSCTWEIAAVPYIPVMDLVAEHCSNLKKCNVDGMLLSWTLGGYPSPNLEIPKRFDRSPVPSKDEVLDEMARERYGKGAELARKAWTTFSDAFRTYPFSGGVVYNAPVQMGPANLLRLKPSGYKATMVGLPYDDIIGWCHIYPPDKYADQFAYIAGKFREGASILEQAIDQANAPSPDHQPKNRAANAERVAELRYAKAVSNHFASVSNQVRFILLRDKWIPESDVNRKREYAEQMVSIVRDEMKQTRDQYELTRTDSSIGFESSNQYFYVPNDLLEKLISCQAIVSELEKSM